MKFKQFIKLTLVGSMAAATIGGLVACQPGAGGKVPEIALFREDLQEIQHIIVHFSPKTLLQNGAALLLGNGHILKKLPVIRILFHQLQHLPQLDADHFFLAFFFGRDQK